MAGLYPLSLHQILDEFGTPVKGCLAWFYEASTLDPLPVYTDYNVGVPGPNPWPADGYGRFPPIYLAEGGSGFYRHRVTSAEGAIIPGLDLQQLPVIGPSGGGGGGGAPVDPNALTKTGDFVFTLSSDPRDGFVRANGLTIGSAASGATERPNADTEPLFTFLYQRMSDALCPVSGGRGASAAADFAANKRLALPDARGRTPFGIDTMGNVAAGRITAFTAPSGGNTVGSSGGAESFVQTVAQLAQHGHALNVSTGSFAAAAGGGANVALSALTGNFTGQTGLSAPINKMPGFMLGGYYIKL
jgi:hypothetical protein